VGDDEGSADCGASRITDDQRNQNHDIASPLIGSIVGNMTDVEQAGGHRQQGRFQAAQERSKAIAFYQQAAGLRLGRRFGSLGVEMLGTSSAIYLLVKPDGWAIEAGATIEGEIQTHNWGRIAHMADPFGHGICFIQFLGRGYDEISHE